MGKGIINLIVHHVDPIGSLPVSLALRISLHFDKVDTFALSNEELHHLVIFLVKRHIDRVVSGSVHAKALNKVEVVAEDLDLGCRAISAGNYKEVCTYNRLILLTIHLAINELEILWNEDPSIFEIYIEGVAVHEAIIHCKHVNLRIVVLVAAKFVSVIRWEKGNVCRVTHGNGVLSVVLDKRFLIKHNLGVGQSYNWETIENPKIINDLPCLQVQFHDVLLNDTTIASLLSTIDLVVVVEPGDAIKTSLKSGVRANHTADLAVHCALIRCLSNFVSFIDFEGVRASQEWQSGPLVHLALCM